MAIAVVFGSSIPGLETGHAETDGSHVGIGGHVAGFSGHCVERHAQNMVNWRHQTRNSCAVRRFVTLWCGYIIQRISKFGLSAVNVKCVQHAETTIELKSLGDGML